MGSLRWTAGGTIVRHRYVGATRTGGNGAASTSNAALAALMCDFDGHRVPTHGDVSAKAPPCGSAIACQFLVWQQKTAILGVGCRRFLADGPN